MRIQNGFPFILVLAAGLLSASAQTNQAAIAAASPSPSEKLIQQIKNPTDWFSWGGDLRLRNERFQDLLTLNSAAARHEQDYFRMRTRLWAGIAASNDLSLNVRLATEPRNWLNPAGYSPYAPHTGVDISELMTDSLNVKWKNALGLPMVVTVGRQDILLGDGWLTGDGTPLDGSWTYFLDAARFTYELKDQHTTIEAIGIMQSAKDDAWMPTINDQDRYVTEQNEKGAILSIANTSCKAANLTGYFIYKHDDATPGIAAKYHPDSGDIYTVDGRLTGAVGEHWKYSAEGAYQFGRKQDLSIQFPAVSTDFRRVNAFGWNTKATYLFQDSWHNQLSLSYEFLTGDNPNTKSDEMFDDLWGRWPRWSEIGLYSFAAETRIGEEANMHRLGPTWSISPAKDLEYSASYFALFSQEDVATRAPQTLFSGTGKFRGHFLSSVVKYKFTPHLTGHLWSEDLFPGDYYVNRNTMMFLRAEMMFTF